MKKESGKKKWIIIIVVIILIILVLVIVGYFILNKSGSSFGGAGLDFSSGTNTGARISEATNANSFDNVKLNPFNEETG